jgi:hypothetical protein
MYKVFTGANPNPSSQHKLGNNNTEGSRNDLDFDSPKGRNERIRNTFDDFGFENEKGKGKASLRSRRSCFESQSQLSDHRTLSVIDQESRGSIHSKSSQMNIIKNGTATAEKKLRDRSLPPVYGGKTWRDDQHTETAKRRARSKSNKPMDENYGVDY